MLRRKIIDDLIAWKKNSKKCLIVEGARQVGKTYIIRYFGRSQYTSFIELNFLEQPSRQEIFSGDLDSDTLLRNLRLFIADAEIVPGKTLLFLDEIQECPNAITSLKFLAGDARVDVIASGSALGMAYNRTTSYPVGSIDYLDMYPLDFEEFLWAMKIDTALLDDLRMKFQQTKPVDEVVHNRILALLRIYMVIGGMPEVVASYEAKEDYFEADQIQRRIYRDYLADIARYSTPEIKIKAEECYRSIPRQLSKDNHKFQYKSVRDRGTARMFESSLDWLVDAHFVIPVANVKRVEYPLQNFAVANNLRLYPSDIGLLTCTYDYSLKQQLLQDNMEQAPDHLILRTAKGGLYDALAEEMLSKRGRKELHFYRNEAGTVEMEYLLETEDGVIPVEVKTGKTKSRALGKLLAQDDIPYGYRFASKNVGRDGKKITMPL